MKRIKGFDIQFDFSKFKKIADLIYFEGPLLSHFVSSKGNDYLFYWIDRDSTDNRWLIIRVSLASLQRYMAKELSLRELIENPNDGFLYCINVDDSIRYHDVVLMQPTDLPDEYLPAKDSFYAFEPSLSLFGHDGTMVPPWPNHCSTMAEQRRDIGDMK